MMSDAIKAAAALVEARLRSAAPLGTTGKLRASIRSNFSKKYPWGYTGLKKAPGESRPLNYYATLINGRKAHNRYGRPRRGSPQMAGRFPFEEAGRGAAREVIGLLRDGSVLALEQAVKKTQMIEMS
jgi:hypothetical protein